MKYSIYQLRKEKIKDLGFRPLSMINNSPTRANYTLVYQGDIKSHPNSTRTLEEIFFIFNMQHPKGFKGHSLSVSDIVVLDDGKSSQAWYCDMIGWEKISF